MVVRRKVITNQHNIAYKVATPYKKYVKFCYVVNKRLSIVNVHVTLSVLKIYMVNLAVNFKQIVAVRLG